MKRILGIALLLCSTVHAQQIPKVIRQPNATPEILSDGREQLPRKFPGRAARTSNSQPSGYRPAKMAWYLVATTQPPAIRLLRISGAQESLPRQATAELSIASLTTTTLALGLVPATAKFAAADSTTIATCVCGSRTARGNCQSTQNHCYGARIACYNAGGAWYRATQDTYADALIGFWGDGGQSVLSNVLFQHNSVRDALLRGGDQHMMNCIINVQREVKAWDMFNVEGMQPFAGKVGVELGDATSIRGGFVALVNWKHPSNEYSGRPSEAIWVRGDGCVIDTHLIDSDGIDGSIGIRTKGERRGLIVDCIVNGFHQPNERLLVVEDAAHTNGLDITFRINGVVKPIDGYVKIGSGWTGSIKLIDTANGRTMVLQQGMATK